MSDPIQECGIVGAGGAGFPLAVKLRARAETYIVNAAECEPLLHKDKELLVHYADDMLRGLKLGMERTGARRGVIGIKEKYEDVISSISGKLPHNVEICPLSDTYPAGDEFILVFEVTGKVIPPGGLPLDVGAVVSNVETLINAGRLQPVTHKFLTVAGAVKNPITLRVPIGISFREVIDAAGGSTEPEFKTLIGGIMMARLASSIDDPVTKTTGGLILLPLDHILVNRYSKTWAQIDKIGKSACDQCSFCTELCPRYLLGHPIEPHKAMRALCFAPDKDILIMGALYCCECNLCSLISCPEDLDPKNVCVHDKAIARDHGLKWKGDPAEVRPHPLARERRVPVKRLMQKLDLIRFNNAGPLVDIQFNPSRVVLPLRQHVGAPCIPVVKEGQQVRAGDLVAAPAQGALGANIHASINGKVTGINGAVVIEA